MEQGHRMEGRAGGPDERRRGRLKISRAQARQLVPFVALLLIVVAFSSAPNFISSANLENILRQLPVLMLVAVGATFPILAGSIDLSVAGIITLSGGVAALLVPDVGEIALLVAPLVGLAAGAVNGLLVAWARLPSFLVTLGMLFILNGLAVILMDGVPRPYVGEISREVTAGTIGIFGLDITYVTVIAVVLVALVTLFSLRTRWGRYIYAIGGGETVARLSGVRVQRYKLAAFMISGGLAGLAGLVLTMRASAATPTMGDPFLLTSIAAVVVGGTSLLGGLGGPHWTVLGTLVIITLDNGMVIAGMDPNFQTVIRGLVIIVASAITLRRVGVIK